MKNLRFVPFMLIFLAPVGCSTLSLSGKFRDSTLSNSNPAPKSLTPPDYTSDAATPLLDDTFMTSQADYHFTMGETFSYEGNSARAIEEFKMTLIYDPKSVLVRLRLSAEYVRLGMLTEAVEQGEIAVDMAPKSVEARTLLGGLYAGLKMFEPARQQFDAILKLEPGHPEAAIYLGALLAEERKYSESIRYFESLVKNKRFKDTERAHYYLGRIWSERGQGYFKEAEKAFGNALKLKPSYTEAALALGMLYRAQSKERDMEKLFRSYQEKFGPEREMARQLSQYYLEKEDYEKALVQLETLDGFERDNLNIKIQIALILIEQKKYESAAGRLEEVLMQAPESDKVRYYLGAVYEEMNKSDLAIAHYKEIPPASSYFAQAVIHSAHILKNTGNMEKAVNLVEKALEKEKEIPQLYAFYATLLDEQKSFRKALQMLDKAVDRFPTNTQLRFFLGTMHDRMGNSQQTVASMSKVLELDKEHVQAMNYLAYTYAELDKNLDEASELAHRALKLQPNDGYILDTVGWVYFKKGQTERAIKYLEAAFRAKSDEAIIAEHLGDAYLRHQMWQKAQKMYQEAAKLESDQNRAQRIHDKIANVLNQSQRAVRSPASVSPSPK